MTDPIPTPPGQENNATPPATQNPVQTQSTPQHQTVAVAAPPPLQAPIQDTHQSVKAHLRVDGQEDTEALDLGFSEINQKFKEREIAAKAKRMGMPYVNLLELPINPDVFAIIKREVSVDAALVPFYNIGKRLRVAVIDHTNPKSIALVEELKHKFEVDVNICSPESLAHAQKNYEKRFYSDEKAVIAFFDPNIEINLQNELEDAKKLPERMEGQKSDLALNLVHEVVMKLRVSDIHVQPEETSVAIRARVDGVLKEICRISYKLNNLLVQQIKHDAGLKYNITNMPQDGKYTFNASDRDVDVRVSTLPTNFGESVVLRFLDAKKGIVPLQNLGYPVRILEKFDEAINGTMGMILVTGPTGSGKTTTLYSAISKVNTPDKKIVTLEDPIEFRLKGVLQAGVNHNVGFDFAKGLRAILRQDPDVVLVGEIRDKETAETAIQAALTGHIVFSTLHTNSAADAIPRLMNMGVAAFVLAPALRMITAQRLVRKICKNCREERPWADDEKIAIEEVIGSVDQIGYKLEMPKNGFQGKGCDKCGGIKFRGETAITEVLRVDDTIQRLIFTDFSSQNILRVAREAGMLTMWEEGLVNVIDGITTVAEVKRKIARSTPLKKDQEKTPSV